MQLDVTFDKSRISPAHSRRRGEKIGASADLKQSQAFAPAGSDGRWHGRSTDARVDRDE